MDRSLFKYIWKNSWHDQLVILSIVLVSQIFYFVSLDLPKQIVNNAIQGDAFKKFVTDELKVWQDVAKASNIEVKD